LNLVHTEQVNYNESGSIVTDLNWLTSNATVATLRNTYNADLVNMFIENGGGYTGYAWIGPNASQAFSAVARGYATGNLSFPHELGHNMGLLHDPVKSLSCCKFSDGMRFALLTPFVP